MQLLLKQLKKPSKKLFNISDLDQLSTPFMGIDEVGRGCIAGPVCAGVVIFNEKNLKSSDLNNYIDSKKIPEVKRKIISEQIQKDHYFALGWATPEEIDEINIRQATLLAMSRAVVALSIKLNKIIDISKGTLLVDGRDIIPDLIPKFGSLNQRSVVSGDALVKQISAASIVAKVARDELLKTMSVDFPQYGFEKHKGYGTEVHRDAIKKYGVLNFHRKSFGGVKEYI
jgi:ribonuclease HII